MFDVGFTEILLIGIVSLVVIGPERLPAVAKTAGQWIGKLQRFVRGVKTDLASELETGDLKKLIGDQREQINELKNMVNTAKKDFESSTRDVVKGARKSLGELETSVKELDAAPVGSDDENDGIDSLAKSAAPNQTDDSVVSKDEFARMSGHTGSTDQATGTEKNTVAAGNSGPHSTPDPQASTSSIRPAVTTDDKPVESGPTTPPENSGGHQTPTLRSETSIPKDDTAAPNRTGTESGS
ncbi:Sec-independent protein translocase protein TatB [Granulosicoccus sp. 3-233]|uniref:Sec-independent protein translocase protein TatB n=1 Tax=Granulosicoccus sp. 3-233 TaxID=3417969 RepID=UPI003D32EF5F